MSVNPLARGGLSPDLAAIIAEELASLASDARTLQSRLVTGDLVSAIVLPSNGLTDLLDIGGLRVAAELPPTVLPGETITVAVTGFSGDRINLQIVPNPHSDATGAGASTQTQDATPAPVANRSGTGGRAEPAISVAPAKNVAPADGLPNTESRPIIAAVSPRATTRIARPVPPGLGSIEARLATARATTAASSPPRSPGLPSADVAAPVASAKSPKTGAYAAPKLGLAAAVAAATRASAGISRPAIAFRPPAAAAAAVAASAATTPTAVVRGPAAYSEPAALLRALRLPVTLSNVAAARVALTSPERLPHVLDVLQRALSSQTDPHVTTLQTLVGFVARLEPRSPVLASQVAAFVDQVVVGREGKLAQLLAAHVDADAGGATPGAMGLGAERIAVRQAALDYDLKTQLLAVTGDGDTTAGPPAPKDPVLTAAAGNALSAVTALQMNAAATLAANPDGLAFALPMALPSGFTQAHVRISRDHPQAKGTALDGDNFHIAFILETQHLGTVAIDVRTVGRSVTLNVQTEAVLAQLAFGAALTDLTQRLESLRYHIAKADAVVAPRGLALPQPLPVTDELPKPSTNPARLVDLDA